MGNIGKSDGLKDDSALKKILSKPDPTATSGQNREEFRDYAPTAALVEEAIDDVMSVLGLKKKK